MAAGLAYCHKPALGPAERLTGLVYAAANMKRYAELFHVPTPGEGRQLYTDLAHLGQAGRSGASSPASGSPRTVPAQAVPAAPGILAPPNAASPLPAGEVTFLFTDIEGSTSLWESQPKLMRAALELHTATVRAAVAAHGGQVFQIIGDALHVAFSRPADGLAGALEAQRQLRSAAWGALGPLRARMGLHLGAAHKFTKLWERSNPMRAA